ncbi:APC family permease [Actinoplanes solisilvae]|uniref:APC family permease n=1 Tax=Actinoplanes solisilvae TaxID=2486853 RepID=UPI001F0C3150|nr:APC family permease [Actinoplanes solisilvae]
MSSTATKPPQSQLSTALAKDRLGVAAVVFFVMSAAAPLTVVAGVVPTGIAVTELTGISIAFIACAVVLALFAVGYVAMSRHIENAGAFYAYIAQGLGRPVGVGASWVALLAYNMFQIAAYGGFGFIANLQFQEWFGVDIPWWGLALAVWALTAILGVRDVAVNGKVLATLLVAEIVVVVAFSFADMFSPNFTASSAPLDPGTLVGAGSGALLVMAVTGFVGFEQSVVFSEESRDPRRTVARATYISIALIAVLYGFAAWAMISGAGDDVVGRAREESSALFFNVASDQLGSTAVHLGNALFLTSLIAAMISFHNIIARYAFSLGREGVIARAFGRTVPGTGAPKNGSLAQSAFALVVIVVYAVAGWDPLVNLFFWGGTGGGIGVLLLITLAAFAVIGYFMKNPHGEDFWHRLGAPVLSAILLVIMSYLAISNIATLFGVEPGSRPTWVVPLAFGVLLVGGIIWAQILRSSRPQVYAGIGLGARSASSVGGFSAALASTDEPKDHL